MVSDKPCKRTISWKKTLAMWTDLKPSNIVENVPSLKNDILQHIYNRFQEWFFAIHA